MHVRNEPIYLDVYLSLWSLSMRRHVHTRCWRQPALTTFSIAAARIILGRPRLHSPHASPGLSSSCLLVSRRVVSIRQTATGRMGRDPPPSATPPPKRIEKCVRSCL